MKQLMLLLSLLVLSGCGTVHPIQVAFFGFENNLALMKETSPVDSSVFVPIDKAFSKSSNGARRQSMKKENK